MAFRNRELRKTIGPMGDKVIGERRKLHNEMIYNLRSSSNRADNYKVIISSRMGQMHVQHVRGLKIRTFHSENLKGRDCLEDLGVGGRIILKQGINVSGYNWFKLDTASLL
jgi:hypothetical protein